MVSLIGYSALQKKFGPKQPPKKAVAKKGEEAAPQDKSGAEKGKKDLEKDTESANNKSADPDQKQSPEEDPKNNEPEPPENIQRFPKRFATLGDFGGKRAPFLLYFNSRGATLDHVEMVTRQKSGNLRFRNLEQDYGYLGYLALIAEPDVKGCRVRVVGPGTPAALAQPKQGTKKIGVQPGDLLVAVDGKSIQKPQDLTTFLKHKRPGSKVKLELKRVTQPAPNPMDADDTKQVTRVPVSLEATLAAHPLELIQLESDALDNSLPSLRTTLLNLNDVQLKDSRSELSGLRMHRDDWELTNVNEKEVVFRYSVPKAVLVKAKITGSLAIIKRFRLEASSDASDPRYDLSWSLSCEYDGQEPVQLALRQTGLNGLPLEGWWYSTKISPSWGGAGARDVVWKNKSQGSGLLSAHKIYQNIKDGVKSISLLSGDDDTNDRTFTYIGMDTQYFSAVMLPQGKPGTTMMVQDARAIPVGAIGRAKGRKSRTQNSTFQIDLMPVQCQPGNPKERSLYQFRLFLGPKKPEVLAKYGLEDLLEYGWFGFVARPLTHILHFFYKLVRNYGIAIILLTVLVRGAMFPLGRKAAKNAQMMQELAPQIKEIKEQYKKDMEKQAAAMKDLWKKHNFHPLSGCWVMFMQLPIFIGLYRSISVDIELRQAALIPGVSWCSNLSGPDQLFFWKNETFGFITSETGWLGPYFNLLPIITIVLFILQQKMFTPPPTDDQSRMQQKMMKYMMIFFGVLFFKVPSGLCIYFVASSLWGIGERKLLPKPVPKVINDVVDSRKPSWSERLKQWADQKSGRTNTPVDRRKRKLPKARKR